MTDVTGHRTDGNKEPMDDLAWRAAERASSWALQGEVTVQGRFGNFLLADSFLLLSLGRPSTPVAVGRPGARWC
jgi:hypothetical protein